MWQVIYIAASKQLADQLQDGLSREGILVSLRATGASAAGAGAQYELLVPRTEARDAQEILNLLLGRAHYTKR